MRKIGKYDCKSKMKSHPSLSEPEIGLEECELIQNCAQKLRMVGCFTLPFKKEKRSLSFMKSQVEVPLRI